jgi:hypothetical protein
MTARKRRGNSFFMISREDTGKREKGEGGMGAQEAGAGVRKQKADFPFLI